MSGIFGLFPLDSETFLGTEWIVWADARIDYRVDLCRALNIADDSLDDAELILAAYQRWGQACVDHLFGDFAFVIWDPREQRLFCARDHFGMRPLYYHYAPERRFVFASDARALYQVPEVPYAINQGRVADFLVPELEWIDYTSTFFENVYRLPPGHRMVVTPDGFQISEYWKPAPGPKLPTMSEEAYRDGFIEVFVRAIDERMRGSRGKVGVMLSGGMDSGSVAAVANHLLDASGNGPLHTVSAARKQGADCGESQRIYATIDMLGSESTIVDPDEIAEFDDKLIANMAEPFDGEFFFMKAIYHTARRQGLDALLDGGAGDIVLNEGSYVKRLLRHGRFATAYREIVGAQKFWGAGNLPRELFLYLLRALGPQFIKKAVGPYRRRRRAQRFIAESLISREFAEQIDLYERCERMWRMFPADWIADPALERASKIRPNISAGRERYGRLAASAGLAACDPFLDLNVVAYCSQLPGSMLLRNGWPKFILREAMAGKLPDEVRWGRGKPHIGWVYNESFLKREILHGRLSLNQLQEKLGGYIQLAKLRRAWQEFEAGGSSERVYSAYVLSLWLQQAGTRPIVNYSTIL